MIEKPTHLDLFSGIGGFSLAFEAAGFKTVGFAEINRHAAYHLRQSFPSIVNYGDFRQVPRTYVNVVTAGVPCQPASRAGQRRGVKDERWLWWDTIDLLGDIQPDYAVLENVAGLTNLDAGRAFNGILSRLHERGYNAWWTHIPACAVGADHERDRVIIVAHTCRQNQFEQRKSIRRRKSGACEVKENGLYSDTNSKRKYIENIGRRPVYIPSEEHFAQDWQDRLSAFCGMDDGVSRRLAESKPYGNAILPQVAYIFAKAIYEQIMNGKAA